MTMIGSATQYPGQARRCGILLTRKLDSTTLPLPDFFQAALVFPLNNKIAHHTRRFTTRIKNGNYNLHIGHINVLNRVVLSTPGLQDELGRARGLKSINQILKPHGFEFVFNVAAARIDLRFDYVERGTFSQVGGDEVDGILSAQRERLGELGVFRRAPTSERLTDDFVTRYGEEIRDILLSEARNPVPDMNVLSQAASYLCRQGYLESFLEVGEIFLKRGKRILDFFEFSSDREEQVVEIILRQAQINYLAGNYARAEEVMLDQAESFLKYAFEETLVWYSLIRTRQRSGIPLAHFLASDRVASKDPSLLEQTLLLNARLYASLFTIPSEEDLMELVYKREELEEADDESIKLLLESTKMIMQWVFLLLDDSDAAEKIGSSYQEKDAPFLFNALGAILLAKKGEYPNRLAEKARLSDSQIERRMVIALEEYTDNFVEEGSDIVTGSKQTGLVDKIRGNNILFVAVNSVLNEVAPLSQEEDDDGDQGDGKKPPYSPPTSEPEAPVRDAEHTVSTYWVPLLKKAFPRGEREGLIERYEGEVQGLRELLGETNINYEQVFKVEREISHVLPFVPVADNVDVLGELNTKKVTLVWKDGLKVRVYLAERTWRDPKYLEEEVLVETLSLDEKVYHKLNFAAMFLEVLIMYGIQETVFSEEAK